jgi:transglutaminase-like putative cysteine protease
MTSNMPSNTSEYLVKTNMLNFEHKSIQELIARKQWKLLNQYDAIGAVYSFVRDEIKFGYNEDDKLSASRVLEDGYGQCNTKGTLLMALLRGVGIPVRFHGFTIFNELQRGAIPNYLISIAPERIIHSWVEVLFEGRWLNLEGYIIDRAYLGKVQNRFADQCGAFSGYGIATPCLKNPAIDWQGDNTYIQNEGIADDFGAYAQPDDFYRVHGSNLSGIKKILFRYVMRHLMNRNVNSIRETGIPN